VLAGRGHGDLVADVRAVAAAMLARGLAVHVEITGDDPLGVPATVATAISGAVREALANVLIHARTGEAWVDVSFMPSDPSDPSDPSGPSGPSDPSGADALTSSRVQVIVRDSGIGFDPASADPARLGLRRSITERIADCGGQASIWSAPGRGTVVRLSWPAPVPAGLAIGAAVEEGPAW
jgi:signal transduction histidine kinase